MVKSRLSYWFLFPLFLTILSYSSPKKDAIKPNILFVSIDDLRPTLGAYGDTVAITPNIDNLAAEGMTFRQTFTPVSVCAPSE